MCSVKGGELFLEACGFKQKLLDQNGKEEQFYVLQLEEDKLNDETLSSYTELLKGVTPVRPSVDRRPQVLPELLLIGSLQLASIVLIVSMCKDSLCYMYTICTILLGGGGSAILLGGGGSVILLGGGGSVILLGGEGL